MRFTNGFFIGLSFMVLCSAGCQSSKADGSAPDNILAIVNGEAITEDDLYLVLNDVHGPGKGSESRAEAIEDLINQELLYQQGRKLGLDKDLKYRNIIKVMEMRVREFKRAEMARRVTSTRIAATVNVTDEDARKYYAKNEAAISADFRFFVIQFPDEYKAREAHQKIKEGLPFETVASRFYPLVPGGNTPPWDSGFLHWNQVPVEWAGVLSVMKKGDLSGVLISPRAGISVLALIETRKNTDATFEVMSASIMSRIRDMRISEAYDRHIQDLRKASKIVKHEERRNSS